MDHSLEEFLHLYELVQMARKERGAESHKLDNDCFEAAQKVDKARKEKAPVHNAPGHHRDGCWDCQQVAPLVHALAARLQAQGITFSPGVLQ